MIAGAAAAVVMFALGAGAGLAAALVACCLQAIAGAALGRTVTNALTSAS